MTSSVETLGSSVARATEIFKTFSPGKPELVDIGLPGFRHIIPGVFPGTLVVIAAGTGVGKTNLALDMLYSAESPGGLISTEDPEDVMGVRIISKGTGIPQNLVRAKKLTEEQIDSISDFQMKLDEREGGPFFIYRIGATIDDVKEAVGLLTEQGAKFIVLDYLQKVRGHKEDRRNEIGETMVTFQRTCHRNGAVPILLCQLSRAGAQTKPSIHHLKESGDIENEARLIFLGQVIEEDDVQKVRWRLSKSTFGGNGAYADYFYDASGTLRRVESEESE